MAKFVTNNIKFVFTKLSLFLIWKNLDLRINFDIINLSDIVTHKQINKRKAMNILKAI